MKENYKLDNKDKKIIKALEEDGRALIKEISKKTKIPRDSVQYRIKRLIAKKIIKGFVPICDTNKIGHPVYTWLNLTLQQFEKEKEFQNFLKNLPNIVYVAKTTGKYHYLLAIATKSIKDLDDTINKIISTFPNKIKDYVSSLMIEEIQYDTFYRLI